MHFRTLKQILSVFCLFKNPKVLHRQHDLRSLYTSVSAGTTGCTRVHVHTCVHVCGHWWLQPASLAAPVAPGPRSARTCSEVSVHIQVI